MVFGAPRDLDARALVGARRRPRRAARGKAIGLLPVLVMVMLIVHSLAESRLLIEIGFALLVVFAIRTRSNRGQNQHLPGRATPA